MRLRDLDPSTTRRSRSAEAGDRDGIVEGGARTVGGCRCSPGRSRKCRRRLHLARGPHQPSRCRPVLHGLRLEWGHVVADLVGDVRRYARPRTVYERASAARVSLAVAGDGDLLEVLTFERRWFPNWVRWFESPTGSILLARDDKMRSWAVCCSPVPVNARSSGRCSAATWLGSAAWGSQSGLPAPGLAAPWSCGRPSCCGTLEPGCAMSAGPGRQLFMSVWATGRGDAT